jgi:hypothetical protein
LLWRKRVKGCGKRQTPRGVKGFFLPISIHVRGLALGSSSLMDSIWGQ